MGAIFGRDQKAYVRWRQSARRAPTHRGQGLTGAALESAVMNIAKRFPDNVIVG